MEEKLVYQTPVIEITEFSLEDSIATSAGLQGVSIWEEMWGNE